MKWLAGVLMAACATTVNGQETGPNTGKPQEVRIHTSPGRKLGPNDVITPGQLQTKVNPAYPPLARQAKISGIVQLRAAIGSDGAVRQLELVSGHPLLVQAALDAVKQWKYEPTRVNGEPVDVDTTIDVVFSLDDPKPESPKLIGGVLLPGQANVDPQLRQDIVKLLEETEATKASEATMRKMLESMRPMLLRAFTGLERRDKIVDSYEDKIVGIARADDFREAIIAAYAKYFNDDDVKALRAFYQTPTGKKFNQELPKFSADLVEAGQAIAKIKMPGIMQDLCHEYPELGGKMPECPAGDSGKKSELLQPSATERTLSR